VDYILHSDRIKKLFDKYASLKDESGTLSSYKEVEEDYDDDGGGGHLMMHASCSSYKGQNDGVSLTAILLRRFGRDDYCYYY